MSFIRLASGRFSPESPAGTRAPFASGPAHPLVRSLPINNNNQSPLTHRRFPILKTYKSWVDFFFGKLSDLKRTRSCIFRNRKHDRLFLSYLTSPHFHRLSHGDNNNIDCCYPGILFIRKESSFPFVPALRINKFRPPRNNSAQSIACAHCILPTKDAIRTKHITPKQDQDGSLL